MSAQTPSTIDALTSGGQRAKVHDAQLVIKLPASAKDLIQKAAKESGSSDAAVVRLAIAEFFERRGIA